MLTLFALSVFFTAFASSLPSSYDSTGYAHRPQCPPDYKPNRILAGCLKLFEEAQTFWDAKQTCAGDNARLLADVRPKVIRMLGRKIDARWEPEAAIPHYMDFALLGVTRSSDDDNLWTDDLNNQVTIKEKSWGRGEPNNFNHEENCLSVNREGGLNDFFCSKPAVFFCYKDYD